MPAATSELGIFDRIDNPPNRNNNPLNIKLGGATKKYVDQGLAEVGGAGKDGGNFLKFQSPEEGTKAAVDLLFNNFYQHMPLDSAMRTWSGGGYGAKDILPDVDSTTVLKDLSPEDKGRLVASMSKREGYIGSGTSGLEEPAPAPTASADSSGGLGIFDRIEPSKPSHGASGEWTPPDTGIVSGISRGLQNLNPMPMIHDVVANVQSNLHPQPAVTNAEDSNSRFEQALQHMSEHPVSTALSQIPLVGPMLGSMAERFPHDPTGALAEAATTGAGALALDAGIGKVSKYVKERKAYAQDRPNWFTKPEGHLQNALQPDLDPAGLLRAGHDLKAGEALIKTPVKDIDTARAASDAQFKQVLMPMRRALIDPQASVVVPGSRQGWIDAKVKSIPDSVRPGTPDYQSIVEDIYANAPTQDLTIGDLEKINSSLNDTNSAFHRAKFSSALSKLETVKGAGDVALEQATRKMMQEAMDKNGYAGAAELRATNSRIGAQIKIKDAIDAAERRARTEATQPMGARVLQEAGQTVGNTIRRTIPGSSPLTVNENIASAMRNWKGKPADFGLMKQPRRIVADPNLGSEMNVTHDFGVPPSDVGRVGGVEMHPSRLITTSPHEVPIKLPSYTGGEDRGPSGITDVRTGKPLVKDLGGGLSTGTGAGEIGTVVPGSELRSADSYKTPKEIEAAKALWKSGVTPRPVGQQLDLQKGIPPSLFGIEQTPYEWNPTVRATSTMADLHALAREIDAHVKASAGSNSAGIRQAMQDAVDVRKEIYRRQQAQRAGK